jgi:hypothetical protein
MLIQDLDSRVTNIEPRVLPLGGDTDQYLGPDGWEDLPSGTIPDGLGTNSRLFWNSGDIWESTTAPSISDYVQALVVDSSGDNVWSNMPEDGTDTNDMLFWLGSGGGWTSTLTEAAGAGDILSVDITSGFVDWSGAVPSATDTLLRWDTTNGLEYKSLFTVLGLNGTNAGLVYSDGSALSIVENVVAESGYLSPRGLFSKPEWDA